MKKIFLPLLLFVLPLGMMGQDCSSLYSFFKEGVTLQYTSYDKKDKVEGTITQTVRGIEEKADTVIARIDMSTTDAKGKESMTHSFPMKCHNGVLYMDMRSMMPAQANGMEQSPQIEIEMTGNDLTFPPDMEPGQTLPDAEMETKIRMGGMQLMSSKYQVKNRKVEAKESVTTPAGTFDCVKISYDFEYKAMGTRTMRSEYWYATEVGMVKSISYDRKGKVESWSELTKFEK
ncbi:MAG: hypothetical protein EP344_15470 [Bacteroidetes bacterium]|nr:MAG: hypothetical protein EP344_15470 [Bacteroidota bacterium]